MAKREKPPKPRPNSPKTKSPNLGSRPSTKQVPRPRVQGDKKWTFSFVYWNQIDFFGLGSDVVSLNWFVSFLEKLKGLSGKTIEQVMFREAAAYRFHPIDWNQRNIPISKDDIDWIPSYIMGSEEFPFYQFQISTALGRVIGYFDYEYVFHIVLLDPKHNAQPSRYDNYQIQATQLLPNDYQVLMKELVSIQRTAQSNCDENCNVLAEASQSLVIDDFVFIDGEFRATIDNLSSTYGYDDLFHLMFDAFEALEEKKGTQDGSSS